VQPYEPSHRRTSLGNDLLGSHDSPDDGRYVRLQGVGQQGLAPGAASSVLYSITVAGTAPPSTTCPAGDPSGVRGGHQFVVAHSRSGRNQGHDPWQWFRNTWIGEVWHRHRENLVLDPDVHRRHVPATSGFTPWLYSHVTGPLWYRHAPTTLVTETPRGAAASSAVSFCLDSHMQQGWHENKQAGRNHGRHAGERN